MSNQISLVFKFQIYFKTPDVPPDSRLPTPERKPGPRGHEKHEMGSISADMKNKFQKQMRIGIVQSNAMPALLSSVVPSRAYRSQSVRGVVIKLNQRIL